MFWLLFHQWGTVQELKKMYFGSCKDVSQLGAGVVLTASGMYSFVFLLCSCLDCGLLYTQKKSDRMQNHVLVSCIESTQPTQDLPYKLKHFKPPHTNKKPELELLEDTLLNLFCFKQPSIKLRPFKIPLCSRDPRS